MRPRALIALLAASLLLVGPAGQESHAAESPVSTHRGFDGDDEVFWAIYQQIAGQTVGFSADGELRIAEAVHRAALEQDVDPFLVLAVIQVESSFIRGQRSSAGALGLMQVKPSTAEAFAETAGVRWRGPETLFDVESNIRIGTHYLAFKLERFDADLSLALAAYCHGPTKIRRILREEGSLDDEHRRYGEKVVAEYLRYLAGAGLRVS